MVLYRRDAGHPWTIDFVYRGQRVKRSSGTKSKSEAREIEHRLRAELRQQALHGKTPDMTLAEAMARYAATVVKLGRSDGTRELYVFKRLGEAFGADTLIGSLTTKRIHDWRDAQLALGLKPASVNRYLDILRAILNKAREEWGTLRQVPAIKNLKVQNAKLRFLDEEEEARLLEAAPVHLRQLIAFLLGTGARKSEALKLTWNDIDLYNNTRARVIFKDTKSGKPRTVPLPNSLRDMLRKMRDNAPKREKRVFLFENSKGKLVPFDSVNNSFDTARKAAGLRDVSLHTLRHTYASRLVTRGVPIFDVSKLLGHSKIQMTMRYAHLAPEALDAAVAALDV